MEVQAQARWVRTAPRKARLVALAVRGMPVADALAACDFMPRAAARDVAKVIRSAQANAEHNFNLSKDDLVLKDIVVEAGPMLKRGQPRAMGRLFSVFKRMSHITAVVEDRPGVARRRRAARAPQPAPRRAPAPRPETGRATAPAEPETDEVATETQTEEKSARQTARPKAPRKAAPKETGKTRTSKQTGKETTSRSERGKDSSSQKKSKDKEKG
jgi:large subunit ribosomal protein L22